MTGVGYFLKAFDEGAKKCGVTCGDILEIRTEFNHSTGRRRFMVLIERPDGVAVAFEIEEPALCVCD